MRVVRMQTALKSHLGNNQHKNHFSSWKLSGLGRNLFRELEQRKFWEAKEGG